MNPELKQRWIEALKSDRYPKIKHVYRNCNGFCAIGVLADVVDPNGWRNEPNSDGVIVFEGPVVIDIIGGSVFNSITALNDEADWTFPQIAKWVEEYIHAS